ncbi:hypothetical protein JOQ06_006972, partial [Pogonophryne albipinna]
MNGAVVPAPRTKSAHIFFPPAAQRREFCFWRGRRKDYMEDYRKGTLKWRRSSEFSGLELLLLPVSPRKRRIQQRKTGDKLCARCRGFQRLKSRLCGFRASCTHWGEAGGPGKKGGGGRGGERRRDGA